MEAKTISAKTQWWLDHKDDPRIKEGMKEARRRYYYKNQEKEKAESLARYYARKAAKEAAAVPAAAVDAVPAV
jgi:hypothetical protein